MDDMTYLASAFAENDGSTVDMDSHLDKPTRNVQTRANIAMALCLEFIYPPHYLQAKPIRDHFPVREHEHTARAREISGRQGGDATQNRSVLGRQSGSDCCNHMHTEVASHMPASVIVICVNVFSMPNEIVNVCACRIYL